MNFFASDSFLSTLAHVVAPGRPFEIGLYETEGDLFRLVSVDGGPPITSWPFFDSVRAVPREPGAPVRPVRYLPVATLSSERLTAIPESLDFGPGRLPAPYIDWSGFSSWDDFMAYVVTRRNNLPRDSRQKRRKLETAHGPITFVAQDTRPEVFTRCLEWKSGQYVKSELTDMFADPRNVELFRTLHEKKALLVSSLTVGDTLVAVHIGGLVEDGVYSWIPSYDPAYSKFSPGRILLEEVLRESLGRGHREFDFGIGHADYKWPYSTHNRVVGPLGRPPIGLALRREAKSAAKRVLSRWPTILERVRQLRRQLRAR